MRDISRLHPVLQQKIEELKAECNRKGLKIGIGECLRTVEEQDALYAQGRTKKGSIVTNAKGSSYSSMHQWGVAFDFYRNDGKGAYADSDGFFTKVGKIGQSLGLEWGGSWKNPVDKPHFQLPDWGSTASRLKSIYGKPEKFFASWTAPATPQNLDYYAPVFNATYYANKYADLKSAFGTDKNKLLNHFINSGMKEARQGCADFNPAIYRKRYADLDKAFGNDWKKYYLHFIENGKKENRKGI